LPVEPTIAKPVMVVPKMDISSKMGPTERLTTK